MTTQHCVVRQLVQHHPPYIVLRQKTAHTRSGEQQKLQTAQKYRAVAANSVLIGEMELLEPEAEDSAPRNLNYAALSFLLKLVVIARLGPSTSGRPSSPGLLARPSPP